MTNKAKNVVKILAVVAILVLAMSIVLVGCDKVKDAGKPEAEVGTKHIAILIGTKETGTYLSMETDEEYMAAVLLKLAEEGRITNYDYSASSFGTFVNSINDIPGEVPGGFVSVYMTINDVELVDQSGYMPPVEIGSKTFYASSVGIDLVPIRDGETYLFLLGVYNG